MSNSNGLRSLYIQTSYDLHRATPGVRDIKLHGVELQGCCVLVFSFPARVKNVKVFLFYIVCFVISLVLSFLFGDERRVGRGMSGGKASTHVGAWSRAAREKVRELEGRRSLALRVRTTNTKVTSRKSKCGC